MPYRLNETTGLIDYDKIEVRETLVAVLRLDVAWG
jgi:hypothetical protein